MTLPPTPPSTGARTSTSAQSRRTWLRRVRDARELLPAGVRDTPLAHRRELDDALGAEVWLKNECLGPVRSFKARGTEVLFAHRAPTTSVVCASAGNFGQGVAWSAAARGVGCLVYASVEASPLKVRRMRQLGAEVRLAGRDLDAAKEVARLEAAERGWTFLEDGREEELFLGAATMGQELERDLAKELDGGAGGVDALLCPVGNGALFGGLAGWFAARGLAAERVGVVARAAPCMELSFRAGEPVSTPTAETVADGIAVRTPVGRGVERVNACADDVVSVSEDSLAAAVRLLVATLGLVVEPAGAAAVAALLEHADRWRGRRVAVPLCGSNVDPERLAALLTRGRTE